MLVMSVNSKRQRRPNVRLGEIGDISAAWACGFSHNTREKLAHKTWKQAAADDHNTLFGYCNPSSSEFTVSEFSVTPQLLTELQQNGENNNLNSSELAMEAATSAELIDMTKSKLNFSNVTRKCRDMKRRGRSGNDVYAVCGGGWSSKHSPDGFSVDEKECEDADECNGYISADGFDDFEDHQTPTTSKETYEYDIYQHPLLQEGKLKNDAQFDRETRVEINDANAVGRWLEDVGFGKYASVFEMHEVDEEALLLLTIEDLKEMGVFSVGSRRKLYSAIRRLRGEE